MKVTPRFYKIEREILLGVACLLAILGFTAASPYFLTESNLTTIARNSVELLVISLGMTLVLVAGGIDISVGAALGIVAIFVGWATQAGWQAAPLLMLGPMIGAMLGFISGAIIVWVGIPPIIVTLGLLGVYRAAIFALVGGSWISGIPNTLGWLVTGSVLGIPLVILELLVLYSLIWLIFRKFPFGIWIRAIGGNEEASRLAGVNVARVKLAVYSLSGTLAGLAAVFYVARYRNVEVNIGTTVALDAIAAAVLGGASVLGGKGSLLGTALGVILIRILQNGFVLVGIPSLWEQVITGGLLIAILFLEFSRRQANIQHWHQRPL